MNKTRNPNTNPAVEAIMQAYLKTHMTEVQFEALIEKTIQDAKHEGGGGDTQVAYDRGFSEGYDTAMAELK
jgi:hypothetical protein